MTHNPMLFWENWIAKAERLLGRAATGMPVDPDAEWERDLLRIHFEDGSTPQQAIAAIDESRGERILNA